MPDLDRVTILKTETVRCDAQRCKRFAPPVRCELEEKEKFWNDVDEVTHSIFRDNRVEIDADFNRGDEEVFSKLDVQDRNAKEVVDFAKRMKMVAENTSFQKRQENRVTLIRVTVGAHRWGLLFV